MRRNVRRIVLVSAVVALVGLLLVSTVALAKGPDGATKARTQARSGDAGQAQLQTQTQSPDRLQLRLADGTCSTCSGTGTQVRSGAQVQNGDGFGPGDGTGPIPGGSFGPGPKGQCLDVDNDGICDCQE
jgi:hypothetical protein